MLLFIFVILSIDEAINIHIHNKEMQNLRKVKKLNAERAQKLYAITQLTTSKKISQNSQSSFIVQNQVPNKQSIASNQQKASQNQICFIKNLDEGKIQVIDKEEKLDKLLSNLSQLPQIDQLLDKLWQNYQTEFEKQEETFLEACYQGNVNIINRVIASKSKHPVDPRRAVTQQGKNGIHLATVSGSYNNVQIIAVLAKINVDINGRTLNENRTPLMLGSILGNQIAVKALLDLKADHSLQDYEGNTALHLACIYNREQIVEILLDKDCSTEILNKKGLTPIQCIAKPQTYEKVKEKQPGIEYSQRAVVFEGQQPVGYRNSRKQDIEKLLKKIRESYDVQQNTQFDDQKQEQTNMSSEHINQTNRRKGYRNEKIKQVMIRQIKQISLSSFKKLSLLGRGAFGEVYLVSNIHDNKRYAMKVLDKGMIMRQNILRYAMTERKILSTVNHPFVVRLHYAFQTNQKLFLVMQYCPGGDLLKMIKKRGKLEEEQTRKYVTEVILALEELHKAEIIYRDLKPGNIVLDQQGHACITDFGLSKEAALSHSFCGSTAYLAPEMIWRRGHTKVLDWYLLGVFIYECLTGRPPFWDTNKQKLLNNIKSGRYKPLGNDFSKEVRDLVEKLLRSNSSKRLGFNGATEIKAHPWFAGMDWQKIENKELVMEKVEPLIGKPIREQNSFQPETVYNKVKGWDFAPEPN